MKRSRRLIFSNVSLRTTPPAEDGSVLVLAMLVTLIILGVGLAAMWVSSSEMKITGNMTRRQEGLNSAESGLERARAILATTSSTWADLLSTASCGATKDDTGTGGKGKILCEGNPPTTPMEDVALVEGSGLASTGMVNMTYTIWIRNDNAEMASNSQQGLPPETDRDRRLIARVEATGRDGLSFFAIEAVLSAPVVAIDEDYMGQHGGNAQGTHSGQGYIAVPSGP